MDPAKTIQRIRYEIQVEGVLDQGWSDTFNGLISHSHDEADEALTTLQIQVWDQAQLRGIVNKIWDLNLKLVYLKQLSKYSDWDL